MTLPPNPELIPVLIRWEDATKDIDFSGFPEEAGETAICEDIGFLIKKTRKMVVLAGCYTPSDGQVRWIMSIPAKMVREIVYLGPKDEK